MSVSNQLFDVMPKLPEAEFLYGQKKLLAIDIEDAHKELAASYFARQIIREPQRLWLHLQRINLHAQYQDTKKAFAALIDLFLALDTAGGALKKRCFNSIEHLLSADQKSLVNQGLREGRIDPLSPVLASIEAESVLLADAILTPPFISKLELEKKPSQPDPLIEANLFIEHGQIDEAETLLMQAIVNEPKRGEYQKELLRLLEYRADYAHFKKHLTVLNKHSVELEKGWDALGNRLQHVI